MLYRTTYLISLHSEKRFCGASLEARDNQSSEQVKAGPDKEAGKSQMDKAKGVYRKRPL